jgi:alkaline phosphatase
VHTPLILTSLFVLLASGAQAATRIRIMPPADGVLAEGQRFDIRVEATADVPEPPRGLRVLVNGRDITAQSLLDPGPGGERGAGGTGATGGHLAEDDRASGAPVNTTNFLVRDFSVDERGPLVIEARTADGAMATNRLRVGGWREREAGGGDEVRPRARNVIVLLGDGMGLAQRTAARIVSRGFRNGRAAGRLAMDALDVTGLVITGSLNSVVTDSSPGMAAYSTGQKSNNNQHGVFPDNTLEPFDNPRIEFLGAMLRRTRGDGFSVGIVTTADVTDSTPAGNAVHTADRNAGAGIAQRFFDQRDRHGVAVLLGGGRRNFVPEADGGVRTDARRIDQEFAAAGYSWLTTGADVRTLLEGGTPPPRILGLFHPRHLPVAFDKVGAGRYSDELAQPANAAYRDTPMLDDLARLAIGSLAAHAPAGFYLMIEGASIDKEGHDADAERAIWDVIEFDRAVQVALDFAARTNGDADPDNDTLVIVTADHEVGGFAIIGVGNERYAPQTLGRAVRDYAAVYRFEPQQELNFVPNYEVDERGYPVDPDPSRKLLIGWASAPDHHENWISNRLQHEAAVKNAEGASVANPGRDGAAPSSDNRTVGGQAIPGFFVGGVVENGATPCPAADGCPADTAADALTEAGHTGTDIPLSATGPGAWQFTGVYENTDVFLKILRSTTGAYR